MAILAECPICHRKQTTKNKRCACGEDLDKAKQSKRVRYWVSFRLPDGRQRRELVKGTDADPCSIKDARALEGKRKTQHKERRFFEMLPESEITFNELREWYLNLTKVKGLKTYERIGQGIKNFTQEFDNKEVGSIRPVDLEEYQDKRENEGKAPATIDMEIRLVKTMVKKAFDNDKVSGDALKPFNRIEKKLKKGSNARKRLITIDEYLRLLDVAPAYRKAIYITAMNTGMRKGELRQLSWSFIDKKGGFIRIPGKITKTGEPRGVPINHHVKEVLDTLPHCLHHDFVFTFNNNPISHKDSLKKGFQVDCERAGIPYGRKTANGATIHDFRRTVKTYMVDAGVDKAHRDMILGHSLQGMDAHYLAPTEQSLKEAMEKYTDWLDSQLPKAAGELGIRRLADYN